METLNISTTGRIGKRNAHANGARPQRRKEQSRAAPSKARQRRRRDRYRPNRNGRVQLRLITLGVCR
jgi:hypothetical protein